MSLIPVIPTQIGIYRSQNVNLVGKMAPEEIGRIKEIAKIGPCIESDNKVYPIEIGDQIDVIYTDDCIVSLIMVEKY